MDYKEKLEKEGSKILHEYSHKVGGKPVYFVKNKHTEKRHKDEAHLKKIRSHIDKMSAKAKALAQAKAKGKIGTKSNPLPIDHESYTH